MKKYKTKYGTFSSEQLKEYKKKLHNRIHWFLIYYENNYPLLDKYFENIQYYLNGLDEVLKYPMEMVELIATIETARLEFNKPNCDPKVYKKLILDAHSIIDKLPDNTEEGECDGQSI